MNEEKLESTLLSLSREAKELYLFDNIRELYNIPTPIEFLRHNVMLNQPVVIRNGVKHWKALSKWSMEYLTDKIGNKEVTVSFTPNGLADAPVGEYFVLPHEEKIKFSKVADILHRNSETDIAYVQNQNSNFLDEFDELLTDTEAEIPWASEAFGKQPDAVNIWLGNKHSITSMHKDHYENLYAVIKGSKTFILHPPTDLPCLTYKQYKVGRYFKDQNSMYHMKNEDVKELCNHCITELKKSNNIINNEIKIKNKLLERKLKNLVNTCSNDNNSNCGNEVCSIDNDNKEKLINNMTSQSSSVENKISLNAAKLHNNNENMLLGEINCFHRNDNSEDKTITTAETDKMILNNSETSGTQHFTDNYTVNKASKSNNSQSKRSICSCDNPSIPWIANDPLNPNYMKRPKYKHSNGVSVTLHPGDLLYLPSLWFHHVQQSDGTIAVNFWYDMEFDIKYNYHKFVENLLEI